MFRQTLSATVIKIAIKVTISESRKNILRNLAPEEESLPVSCSISGLSSSAANLDCQSDSSVSGTAEGMVIDNDENTEIAGMPEDADPSKTKDPVDYSNEKNLKLIDKLPTVTITSVNGSYCLSNGSYNIYGKYDKRTLEDTSDIIIPFSTVDSSGLCQMIVGNDKTVRFDCENKEEFSVFPIAYETMIIKDSNGTLLFKLNNYTNLQQFACSISVNSISPLRKAPDNINNNSKGGKDTTTQPTQPEKPIKPTHPTPPSPPTQPTTQPDNVNNYRKIKDSSSDGISKLALAGIIVCSIIIIAIIGVLIGLIKSGGIFSDQDHIDNSLRNSSIYQISYEQNS